MAVSSDIIINNIKKQIALNAGQITISNKTGAYGFKDSNNNLIPGQDAANYVLSNIPVTYQASLRAEVYNYAKGVFSGQNVPDELVESLSSLATYYVTQTGVSVQDLFRSGQLDSQFLSTINSFLNTSIQFGYQSINLNQQWINNPTLHGSISAALQPSVR